MLSTRYCATVATGTLASVRQTTQHVQEKDTLWFPRRLSKMCSIQGYELSYQSLSMRCCKDPHFWMYSEGLLHAYG